MMLSQISCSSSAYSDNRNVIWAADTNYRVDLENDVVRHLASSGELDMLIAADQVCCATFGCPVSHGNP